MAVAQGSNGTSVYNFQHVVRWHVLDRCRALQGETMEYRIFFLDDHESIRAKDEFKADMDSAAIQVADHLFDACSEDFSSYELWSGSRCLMPANNVRARERLAIGSAGSISHEAQLIVAERERVLLDSGGILAQSRKLLEKTKALHTVLNIPMSPDNAA
ncbi:MAG TPA: hypothetical protein VGG27_09915 [Magnetospirillaceae bacterium]